MEHLIGAGVGVGVSAFAALSGFDRERGAYPLMLIVIAGYYDLFAAMAGSLQAFACESVPLAGFAAIAIVGFKRDLRLLVFALAGHGVFDLIHPHLIDNAGVPGWWPSFCMTCDFTMAAAFAWRLTRGEPDEVARSPAQAKSSLAFPPVKPRLVDSPAPHGPSSPRRW